MDRLNRTLALVPYRKPVIGEVEFTSGFGVRSDPFLGRPAMHTGLDFRAATGDPVRVTANGKVVSAGWYGGYGRMVEVDHGNGLSTRYGHLSRDQRQGRRDREDRPGHRPRRLDRTFDRPASALRNPHRWRSRRPAEVLARGRASQRGLAIAFSSEVDAGSRQENASKLGLPDAPGRQSSKREIATFTRNPRDLPGQRIDRIRPRHGKIPDLRDGRRRPDRAQAGRSRSHAGNTARSEKVMPPSHRQRREDAETVALDDAIELDAAPAQPIQNELLQA